jgi:hypothetical protein
LRAILSFAPEAPDALREINEFSPVEPVAHGDECKRAIVPVCRWATQFPGHGRPGDGRAGGVEEAHFKACAPRAFHQIGARPPPERGLGGAAFKRFVVALIKPKKAIIATRT